MKIQSKQRLFANVDARTGNAQQSLQTGTIMGKWGQFRIVSNTALVTTYNHIAARLKFRNSLSEIQYSD